MCFTGAYLLSVHVLVYLYCNSCQCSEREIKEAERALAEAQEAYEDAKTNVSQAAFWLGRCVCFFAAECCNVTTICYLLLPCLFGVVEIILSDFDIRFLDPTGLQRRLHLVDAARNRRGQQVLAQGGFDLTLFLRVLFIRCMALCNFTVSTACLECTAPLTSY